MKITYCDRCGVLIAETDDSINFTMISGNRAKEYDLCASCREALYNWLKTRTCDIIASPSRVLIEQGGDLR